MTKRSPSRFRLTALIAVALAALLMLTGPVSAHPEDDGAETEEDLHLHDRDAALEAADEANPSNIISGGPNAKVIKNLDLVGRGERNVADATTDVWAHDGYAYTGTFNNPCGGDPEAGIWVWDVHNKNKPKFVTVIQSPIGSRTNDVRVDSMNSGAILVHSNEPCAGGPGGFEIYNVDDPENPVHLASVQTDDVNLFLQDNFGFVDSGVHNLWLFTQGGNDYVAATVESEFGNFQIFDITDPSNPALAGFWGAEQLAFPGVDWVNLTDFGLILSADAYLFDGFGASANRFLHDVTVSDDGTMAYLANWDAGLVLLDISDPANPAVVSVAIDPVNGSLDGEVNSHSVWPSDDGTIVVEGEEDFSAWEGNIPPTSLTMDGTATPGDPGIPGAAIATLAGDVFEANPTGLTGTVTGTSVSVDGGDTFPAVEFSPAPTQPTFADTGPVTGNLIWVGRACGLSQGDVLL
ncbi:MAG: hypothetical protein OER95_05070, partial [Acidimicrobiia bacterium]|nr:hypothetical protein [Acidimicrobiia bacterium]